MNHTDTDADFNPYADDYNDLYDADSERRFSMIVEVLSKASFGPKNSDDSE